MVQHNGNSDQQASPVLMLKGVPAVDEQELQDWASRDWYLKDRNGAVQRRRTRCVRAYQLSTRHAGICGAFLEMASVQDACFIADCYRRGPPDQFCIRGVYITGEDGLCFSHHDSIRAPSRQSTPAPTPRASPRTRHGKGDRASTIPSPPPTPSHHRGSEGDEDSPAPRVLLAVLKQLTARPGMDDLFWVFAQFGVVERMSCFERAGQDQVLVQYELGKEACLSMHYLNGREVVFASPHPGRAPSCILAIVPSTLPRLTFQVEDNRNTNYESVNTKLRKAQRAPQGLEELVSQGWRIPDFLWGQWVRGPGWLNPPQEDGCCGRIPTPSDGLPDGGEGHCAHIAGICGDPRTRITAQMIFSVCALYGEVVAVKLLYKHRGCALVQFKSKQDAVRAREFLHGIRVFGRQWDVKPSPNRNATHWRGAGTELEDMMCTAGDFPQPPVPAEKFHCPLQRTSLYIWDLPQGLPLSILYATIATHVAAARSTAAPSSPDSSDAGAQNAGQSCVMALGSTDDVFCACALLNGAECTICAVTGTSASPGGSRRDAWRGQLLSTVQRPGQKAPISLPIYAEVPADRLSDALIGWRFALKLHPSPGGHVQARRESAPGPTERRRESLPRRESTHSFTKERRDSVHSTQAAAQHVQHTGHWKPRRSDSPVVVVEAPPPPPPPDTRAPPVMVCHTPYSWEPMPSLEQMPQQQQPEEPQPQYTYSYAPAPTAATVQAEPAGYCDQYAGQYQPYAEAPPQLTSADLYNQYQYQYGNASFGAESTGTYAPTDTPGDVSGASVNGRHTPETWTPGHTPQHTPQHNSQAGRTAGTAWPTPLALSGCG